MGWTNPVRKHEGKVPVERTYYTDDRGKTIMVDRGTLDQFLDLGDKAPEWGARSMDSRTGSKDFTGTTDWSEALDLGRNGWDEGVRRVSDLRDELLDEIGPMLEEPQPMMDVAGFEVDVGAWAAGIPEHMVTTMDLEGAHRQMHVVLNLAANAGVSREALMMRGLLAAGVVDAMEQAGNRVRLSVISHHSERADYYAAVSLKGENEALDLERVTFACGHPSMLRRVVFASMEARPAQERTRIGCDFGYGRPGNDIGDLFDEKPDIYVGNTEQATNLNEVRERVLGYLREAGALAE